MHGNESNRVNGTILYVIQTFISGRSFFYIVCEWVYAILQNAWPVFALNLYHLVIVMPFCYDAIIQL